MTRRSATIAGTASTRVDPAPSTKKREIWQAIAQYKAGFNPWTDQHPEDDTPPISLTTVDNAVHMLFRQDNIDNMTKGFIAADLQEGPIKPQGFSRWPAEQQGAYLVAKGLPDDRDTLIERFFVDPEQHWRDKIQIVWNRWHAMEGDNPPLVRSKAGPRRDFDINLDGMAHYGLLPDMLQDMRNQGLAVEDFAPLFRSAGDYVDVWQRCQSRGQALAAANPYTETAQH